MSATLYRRLGYCAVGLWFACLLLEWMTDRTAGVVLELVDSPNGHHSDPEEVLA